MAIQSGDTADAKAAAKKKVTVMLDNERWRELKLRCIDEEQSAQSILVAALDAYMCGRKGGASR
jgi:hypothetical protein